MNNKEVIVNQVEEKTRNVVLNGGIVHANVHHHEVLDKNVFRDQKFDILVSIFCLEGACSTYDEYVKAFNNIILLIRPGGCLILGSVIEDTTYNSGITKIGNPKIFSVLYLSEKQIFNCIEATGLFDMSTIRKYSLESVMFLMVVKKGL
uniref:Methyltransferase type 11 domain-containing protein n=1 Tax=Acrobeloides nanus TaxID=290746 RepID=A0A914EJM4_9BILA